MPSKTDRFLHDARGPLNTISINAELAKLLAQKSGAQAGIVQALDVILRECQRCNAILLDYAGSSSGEAAEDQPQGGAHS